jgi:sulfur-oxidizing protein SoxX
MRNIPCLLVVLGALVLSGCDTGPKGSIGFTLPDGDVERGKATYVKFGCNACHVTEQIPQLESGAPAAISVLLGGETTRIKSYGELVTSIINPSHRVSRRKSGDLADASGASKMITYNDVMTVSQLIDLVAFLQNNYTHTPYKKTPNPLYWIPEPSQKK